MATYEFMGKITHIVDKSGKSKSGEDYTAFDYRIEESGDEQYPASIVAGSYNKEFGNISIGDVVKCSYNPKARVLDDGRIFGSNNIWRLEAMTPAAGGPPPANNTPPPSPPTPAAAVEGNPPNAGAEDGLPF